MGKTVRYKPVIEGDFWHVTGVPDLGKYNFEGDKHEPVDFGIWQAGDGTWQIWSCIRRTQCGGNTRLFHGWEGASLTDTDWKPLGITMEADTSLGEQEGGLQAPYVTRQGDTWFMHYGDWNRICLATSTDGKTFERYKNRDGEPGLFSGPFGNTRDACVITVDGLHYLYYTGHVRDSWPTCAVFCRTSKDLIHWKTPVAVNYGGLASTRCIWPGGDAECPFVVPYKGQYVLFRNQLYGAQQLNHQYCSDNPLNFGCDNDDCLVGSLEITAPEIVLHDGKYYMACLRKDNRGIQIGKVKFEEC